MKKKMILILSVLLIVISVVSGTIYKRPVTLTQLCPELGLDSCTGITAYYSVDKQYQERTWEPILFAADSEEFDLLMEQIQNQQFRKSFWNFLPSGTKTHPFSEGDFQWEITLEFDDPISMKDGSTASGTLIRITNFYGDLTIENISGEKPVRCNAENQQQWAEEILSIISKG